MTLSVNMFTQRVMGTNPMTEDVPDRKVTRPRSKENFDSGACEFPCPTGLSVLGRVLIPRAA